MPSEQRLEEVKEKSMQIYRARAFQAENSNCKGLEVGVFLAYLGNSQCDWSRMVRGKVGEMFREETRDGGLVVPYKDLRFYSEQNGKHGRVLSRHPPLHRD